MKNASEIKVAISEIAQSSVALRDKIQSVAVAVIGHAMAHGDVTLGTELVVAAGKNSDRQALVRYLEDFGPFKWDKNAEGFKLNKKFRAENTFDEAALNAGTAWYEYGRETHQITSKYDVKARLLGVLNSAEKARIEGKEVENAELVAVVEGALKAYNARVAEALRAAVALDPGKAATPSIAEAAAEHRRSGRRASPKRPPSIAEAAAEEPLRAAA